jgi:hypothetical protein
MKRRTKVLLAFVLLLILLVGFRGPLYRLTVKYHSTGERQQYLLADPGLDEMLHEAKVGRGPEGIEEMIDLALDLTTDQLSFSAKQLPSDPNSMKLPAAANCIGYSAMFNTLLRELIYQDGGMKRYDLTHHVGKLTFLGMDVHALFSSPFFADHDYNSIRDIETGETWYVDPTASDYLRITYISSS